MNKNHIERLQKLNAFLGTIKPSKFSHASTGSIPYNGFNVIADINIPGATADALGYAAMMPDFRRTGLTINWCAKVYQCCRYAYVQFGEVDSEDAGAVFFGLSDEEARYLFVPGSGPDYIGTARITHADYCRRLGEFIQSKM